MHNETKPDEGALYRAVDELAHQFRYLRDFGPQAFAHHAAGAAPAGKKSAAIY